MISAIRQQKLCLFLGTFSMWRICSTVAAVSAAAAVDATLVSAVAATDATTDTWKMDQWMGQVFFADTAMANRVRLQEVVLPGSHDAGAYKMLDTTAGEGRVPTCGSTDLSGVSEDMMNQLVTMEIARAINLVKTQEASILQQLHQGIRFLDLRLGVHEGIIRLHHTLFMDVTFQDVLTQIYTFMSGSESSSETVILKIRLQCRTPVAQVQSMLESSLASFFGYQLTPQVLESTMNEVKGRVYVIYDETDRETSVTMNMEANITRSVSPDEYVKTNPCEGGASKQFYIPIPSAVLPGGGGDENGTCAVWPTFNSDQGAWLQKEIAADCTAHGAQLANWKTTSNTSSFRLLSYIGVIPLGRGCDPTSDAALGTAVLTCSRIGIESYTETFQNQFDAMITSLKTNGMVGSINAIQVDFVDQYDLAAIVQLNENLPDTLSVQSNNEAPVSNSSSSLPEEAPGTTAGASMTNANTTMTTFGLPSSMDNNSTTAPNSTTKASTTEASFRQQSNSTGLWPCWEKLIDDVTLEELTTPHVKLYNDFDCNGTELTQYASIGSLASATMTTTTTTATTVSRGDGGLDGFLGQYSNPVHQPPKDWDNSVRSITMVRCSRTKDNPMTCLEGTYFSLKMLLYPESEFGGNPLTMSCSGGGNRTALEERERVDAYVKTDMVCSFNLPDGWVDLVSSLQILQQPGENPVGGGRRYLRGTGTDKERGGWKVIGAWNNISL